MPNVWVFSASSESLLRECLESAVYDESNEWIQRFKKSVEPKVIPDNLNLETSQKSQEHKQADNNFIVLNETKIAIDATVNNQNSDNDFLELLDTDPQSNLELFINLSHNNEELLEKAADILSDSSVEEICGYIFSNTCNIICIKLFYTKFIYNYMKRNNARLSLDLLLKSQNYNPEYFKPLLIMIIRDTNIQNQLFHDYYVYVGSTHLDLFSLLTEIDLKAEEFIHHVLTIFEMYKNSVKSDKIQGFILSYLISCSILGANDRNFGRLILEYIKSLPLGKKVDVKLENVVEIHKSPFKNPSVNLLKKLKDHYVNGLSCSYN